jgi:hypothetical protein
MGFWPATPITGLHLELAQLSVLSGSSWEILRASGTTRIQAEGKPLGAEFALNT